jgi:toxin HigB-1
LDKIDAVISLEELKIPPGNHLEALKGNRQGQHSIRINVQYRICFVWTPSGPDAVEIVDHH